MTGENSEIVRESKVVFFENMSEGSVDLAAKVVAGKGFGDNFDGNNNGNARMRKIIFSEFQN